MPEIDPSFTALPYRELGAVALGRAQELGASHADFRFERTRHQHLAVRDGSAPDRARHRRRRLRGAGDPSRRLGVRRPEWCATTDEARRVAETALAVAEVAARDDQLAGGDRPGARLRRCHLGLVVRREPPRGADRRRRQRCSSIGPSGSAQGAAVDHATAAVQQVQENKYYADLTGTRTTQQRVRVHPEVRGDGRRGGHLRLHGGASPPRSAGAGSTSPTGSLGLGRRARRATRAAGREAKAAAGVEAGRYDLVDPPVQPLADHPRVDRPRHRARPRTGLRGQLRRHVVRDLRQARHAAVRLPTS